MIPVYPSFKHIFKHRKTISLLYNITRVYGDRHYTYIWADGVSVVITEIIFPFIHDDDNDAKNDMGVGLAIWTSYYSTRLIRNADIGAIRIGPGWAVLRADLTSCHQGTPYDLSNVQYSHIYFSSISLHHFKLFRVI